MAEFSPERIFPAKITMPESVPIEKPDRAKLTKIAEVFRVFSEPTRLAILQLLKERPFSVNEMVEIALKTRPDLVTLVPEKREELTTEGGLDVKAKEEHYKSSVGRLKGAGIEVSFFVDPDPVQIEASHRCGVDIVEIHTGHYAEARSEFEANEQFGRIVIAAESAAELDLRISAGHGLNYLNVKRFRTLLPRVEEYSIGHSIVARAVLVGFERAVREMIELVKDF